MPLDPCFAPLLDAIAARAASGTPPADPIAAARAGLEAMFTHAKAPAVAAVDRTIPGAEIQRRSFGLLDNVAAVLNSHPNIAKVVVEGHTDDRGNDAYNKDLSQRRAEAVVKFLVDKGVDPARLEAVGWGEEKPIDTNRTNRGRSANRRVVLIVLS